MNPAARVDTIAPPTGDVVPIADVKAFARISVPDEDALLAGFVADAVRLVEDLTDRQLVTATFERVLGCFEEDGVDSIDLRPAPLREIVSIKYLDPAGVEQTLDPASYSVVAPVGETCGAGYVVVKDGIFWPDVAVHPQAVRVRFSAGYGGAAEVPGRLKRAVCVAAAALFNSRDQAAAGAAVAHHLEEFRLWRR